MDAEDESKILAKAFSAFKDGRGESLESEAKKLLMFNGPVAPYDLAIMFCRWAENRRLDEREELYFQCVCATLYLRACRFMDDAEDRRKLLAITKTCINRALVLNLVLSDSDLREKLMCLAPLVGINPEEGKSPDIERVSK